MIEKIIHFCWFGYSEKNEIVKRCLQSWETFLPDYEIKMWNEENSPMNHYYVSKMYKKKQWAFMSDYVRLYALYNEGGIYLDTDMEVLKSLDSFLLDKCFVGFEDESNISCGIIGSEKGHPFIKECLNAYDIIKRPVNIPSIFTGILRKQGLNSYGEQIINGVNIYKAEVFYPWPFRTSFSENMIQNNSFTIHHWQRSWKLSWKDKLFQKVESILDIKID